MKLDDVIGAKIETKKIIEEKSSKTEDDKKGEKMIQDGLKEEVSSLLAEGVPEEAQSMQGLGYKEMIPCIRGEYPIEDAADRIRLGTRHYAKRQMTFLKREEKMKYVDVENPGAYEEIKRILK